MLIKETSRDESLRTTTRAPPAPRRRTHDKAALTRQDSTVPVSGHVTPSEPGGGGRMASTGAEFVRTVPERIVLPVRPGATPSPKPPVRIFVGT